MTAMQLVILNWSRKRFILKPLPRNLKFYILIGFIFKQKKYSNVLCVDIFLCFEVLCLKSYLVAADAKHGQKTTMVLLPTQKTNTHAATHATRHHG